MKKRIAVVILNLGGPDSLNAVKPFLFNLFYDPAIIRIPKPWRWLLAHLISIMRAPVAKKIYEQMGGKSPILDNTKLQAQSLEKQISKSLNSKVFVAMRHWHPFTKDTFQKVIKYKPTKIILVPLYPQFSSTTTGSSFKKWETVANEFNCKLEITKVCCYPKNSGWIDAQVDLILHSINHINDLSLFRILFSAHGLPQKIVAQGDPYQKQVENTAAAIVEKLNIKNLDWIVCYQSRVGPLEWIGPSTEEEISKAGLEGKSIILVPIAFVSEHSETLVELDIEYREKAENSGVGTYIRVPAVGNHPKFIAGLEKLVMAAINSQHNTISHQGNLGQYCREIDTNCPLSTLLRKKL